MEKDRKEERKEEVESSNVISNERLRRVIHRVSSKTRRQKCDALKKRDGSVQSLKK